MADRDLSMAFARIFGEFHDQVLVLLDTATDGAPTLAVTYEVEPRRLRTLTIRFSSDRKGREDAEMLFDLLDAERVNALIDKYAGAPAQAG